MESARIRELLSLARIALPPGAEIAISGDDPILDTAYPAGGAAAVAVAAQAAQAAELWRLRTGQSQSVSVDARHAAASLISFALQRLDGGPPQQRVNAANPAVGLYQCADGRWIHLHGGLPRLKVPTLAVLGCDESAPSIAAAVAKWCAADLEDALAAANTCGAIARTAAEWAAHPQGATIAPLPAVEVIRIGDADPEPLPGGDRPLSGLRVVDLTRILAGPSCARTLAEHGANVLHIAAPSQPDLDAFVMDTSHGKRSAWLDLDDAGAAATLRALVRGADVFSQGYRSGALAGRGFAPEDVAALRPGIVYVSINCYGHEGPWATRPGWEQLAQTVTGIAVTQGSPDAPVLIPAALCDYTTGYLAAWGVMAALARRAVEGGSWHIRASLCQTAMWVERAGATHDRSRASGLGDVAPFMTETNTPWGRLAHLRPVAAMSETHPHWAHPTVPLGHDAPSWE